MLGDKAAGVLESYKAGTDADVQAVATKLAGDMFIGFSTWRWSDVQSNTGSKPVFRYLYGRPRPQMRAEMGNAVAGLAGGIIRDTSGSKAIAAAPAATGASHSAEIEYALGQPRNQPCV